MKSNLKPIKHLETELLLRLQKGDEDAFTELYYAFYDKLFGFVLGITHSKPKAEDITQDVFLKIWQNRNEIAAVENIPAFLFRVAQNQTIDQLRKSAREIIALSAHFELGNENTTPEPLELLLNNELKTKISEAVNQLPPQQQKIYTLHKEQGIKQDEIARQLNLSLSTIQSHIKLAMGNIQKYLSTFYSELLIIAVLLSF